MDIIRIFRENLRKKREELNLTQSQLAEKSNLSFTFISQLERGEKEPSLRTAYKISKALNTTIDILLTEKEDKNVAVKKLLNVVKGENKESIEMVTKVAEVIMEEREKYRRMAKKEK